MASTQSAWKQARAITNANIKRIVEGGLRTVDNLSDKLKRLPQRPASIAAKGADAAQVYLLENVGQEMMQVTLAFCLSRTELDEMVKRGTVTQSQADKAIQIFTDAGEAKLSTVHTDFGLSEDQMSLIVTAALLPGNHPLTGAKFDPRTRLLLAKQLPEVLKT